MQFAAYLFLRVRRIQKLIGGAKIASSIHAFISDKIGLFVGPKVTFGSGSTTIGMQAGLSYAF